MTDRLSLATRVMAGLVALALFVLASAAAAAEPGASSEDDYRKPPKPSSLPPWVGAPDHAALWARAQNPPTTLRYGDASDAGLLPEWIARIDDDVRSGLEPSPTYPRYPGAVVLAAKDGVIVEHSAHGYAYKYADSAPTLLPRDQWVPMTKDTIFDLASVSKLFTSVAIVQLVERGQIELDAPVAGYIPAFGQNGKSSITVRMLMTHTSGLPAWAPLYRQYSSPEERINAIYEMAPSHEPGSRYVYSDLGLIVLGELVETVSGKPLDDYVRDNITAPLGMSDTGYNPPAARLERIAATEYQPWTDRGMVRGSVHDENAWSLDGVAGHAGLFSTAHDLAVFAQTMLNGGRYGKTRILEPSSVVQMLTNYNAAFPGDDRGLGFELYQHWYMDALATPVSAGHTGFTGTSLVFNPLDNSFAILLTNRVHPSRSWGSINPWRAMVGRDLGRAIPVRPDTGPDAWFSGVGDNLDNTLSVDLTLPSGTKRLEVALFYDTETGYDFGYVEVSDDGGETFERPRGTVSSRRGSGPSDGAFTGWGGRTWLDGSFDLSAYDGPVTLRFRYHTDRLYGGRGFYVDGIRVVGPGERLLFQGSRPANRDAFIARGWTLSDN